MARRLFTWIGMMSLILPGMAVAQSAEEFIDALGIPEGDIDDITLISGTENMLGSPDGQGSITAHAPPMGYMGTGIFDTLTSCEDEDLPPTGEDGDTIRIEVQLTPPAGMNGFRFYAYFLSREYPEWINSSYNDSFTVVQNSSAFNGNIALDTNGSVIEVDSNLFVVIDQAQLTGTGFDCSGGGGGTGWLQILSPATEGESFTLTFTIGDAGDGIYDSGVFLDSFQWIDNAPPTPCTAHLGDDSCDVMDGDDDDDAAPADDDDLADHPATCALAPRPISPGAIALLTALLTVAYRRRR